MEHQKSTSFIPKNPTRTSVKPKGVRQVFILTYITSILFFGTVIAAIVILVWGTGINKQLDTVKDTLAEQKKSFNQQGLEQVREMDERLKIAGSILDTQVSATKLFTVLEQSTYVPVYITGFDYKKNNAGKIDVALSIRARTFNDAIAQRDILLSDPIFAGATISGPVFTDPKPPEGAPYHSSSEVVFVLEKELETNDIKYEAPVQTTNISELYTEEVSPEESSILTEGETSSVSDVADSIEVEAQTDTSIPEVQPVDITDTISN